MHVAVEMSLYPLTGEFIPPILDFIERLKAQPGLTVVTNSMSTQVSGDYDRVFDGAARGDPPEPRGRRTAPCSS